MPKFKSAHYKEHASVLVSAAAAAIGSLDLYQHYPDGIGYPNSTVPSVHASALPTDTPVLYPYLVSQTQWRAFMASAVRGLRDSMSQMDDHWYAVKSS